MKTYPTFRQLQYFQQLSKTLSFNKAAENCFVTQSTLSAGIKDLECFLGQDLFERSSRSVNLTRFGSNFLSEVELLLGTADKMLENVQSLQNDPTGNMHIGVIPTIAPYYSQFLISKISKRFPNVNLVIDEDLTENLLNKLNSRRIDVAILALPYDLTGLESHIVQHDDFYLAMPKTIKDFQGMISLKEIKNLEFTLLEDGHCLSDHAVSACALSRSVKKQSHKLSSVDTMLSIALLEGKAALITEMMKTTIEQKFPDMKVLSIGPETPKRDIALVWRKTAPRPFLLDIFE